MSISQLSQTGIRPDIEVPELSYGVNPRLPSASAAVEVRYTPEKGRFFVANQDLSPGMSKRLYYREPFSIFSVLAEHD